MSYTNFESNSSIAGNCGFLLFKRTNNFAAVGSGDILGQIQSQGFDGVQFQTASFINISATGAPAVNIPSKIQFYSSTGTATHLAMSIGQDGQVTLTDPFVNQATLIVNNNQSTPNINLRTANATATNAPHMHFTRSHAGTGAVIANDDLGRLEFFGFQGGTAREAAEIKSVAQTVNGTTGVSSYLSFSTVPTTYGAMAERMRISADGNVTINAPISGTALTVTGATGSFAADFTGTNAGGITVSQSTGGSGSYQAVQSSVDVQPVYFNAFKNRAGGDINPGDILMQHNVFGYRGTYQLAASMRCYAESVGATRASGAFDWFTTSTAGVIGQRMILGADGFVTINPPAAAGSALTVNGYNATGTYGAQFLGVVPGALFDGVRVINNTTTAGSSSQIECSVSSQALTTGGDPYLRFVNYGLNAVSIGLDTSTQQLAMTSGSGVGGGGNFFTWSIANNQINLPLQASFHAYSGADQLNVTGAGAAYVVQFNTERFDVANGYNPATGVYTAPAAGKYIFYAQVRVDGLDVAMDQGFMQWNVNGGIFTQNDYKNPFAAGYVGGLNSFQGTIIANLAAADTVSVTIQINNGAGNTADVLAGVYTYFCGQLLS